MAGSGSFRFCVLDFPFLHNFTRLPLYLFNLLLLSTLLVCSKGPWLVPWEREKSFDILRMEAICCPVHGGGNCRSLAGVAGWLALFLGIQVCW